MAHCNTGPVNIDKISATATGTAQRYRRKEIDERVVHEIRAQLCEEIFRACARFKTREMIFDYTGERGTRKRLEYQTTPPQLMLHNGGFTPVTFGVNGSSAATAPSIHDDLQLLDDTPGILKQLKDMSSSRQGG